MSVAVDVAVDDGLRPALSRARIAAIAERVLRAERVKNAMVSIALVTRSRIAVLNARHLGHRGATDVISFGFAPGGVNAAVVGDIYIAPEVARENAARHGVGIREELARLVVHGTLHVLGYAHPETDRVASAMWKRQERLLKSALRGASR
ncbi:MAG: rRNA maturation RNase YbeY [Gemmatimonadota bacterium]|nr:rRNA maturation RNase YbeY [Gemmatimonadota bacterium]